jgi:hypothetical protein
VKGHCQIRNTRERGWERADAEVTRKAALERLQSWRIVRASPTRRRAHSSTRSPSGVMPRNRDPRSTGAIPRFSSRLFIAREKVRLRHARSFGRAPEMVLLRENEQEFELIEHGWAPL